MEKVVGFDGKKGELILEEVEFDVGGLEEPLDVVGLDIFDEELLPRDDVQLAGVFEEGDEQGVHPENYDKEALA